MKSIKIKIDNLNRETSFSVGLNIRFLSVKNNGQVFYVFINF